jgi:LVIVD repeat
VLSIRSGVRPLKRRLVLALTVLVIGLVAAPVSAAAPPRLPVVEDWAITPNLTALSFSERTVPTSGPASNFINSDLAFWGDMVVQGHYNGFRLVDVSQPKKPVEIIDYEECAPKNPTGAVPGNQGDVAIYGDILSRSWNSNTPASGASCDGDFVMPGFEGLHIFDISNRRDPDLIASVDLACGSHTQTMVPDLANDRLLVYVGSSSAACPNFDIVEIPLDNPAGARLLRQVPTEEHPCHDIGVILGSAMKLACAGANSLTIYSLGGPDGGSLELPEEMHHILPGIPSSGHSAAFTYDGKVVVFGWEPGGGLRPACQATGTPLSPPIAGFPVQTDDMKSYFFFSVETGALLGKFVLPRDQGADEACTIHNYNVIPLRKRGGEQRYVLVSGNYMSGISVVDFTDPANAKEIAYADQPAFPNGFEGGDWSTYWYNGHIFESDLVRGLLTWRINDPRVTAYFRTPYSNPQTQEFTID